MEFITVRVFCQPDLIDILIPSFFEIGFDSFQELEDGFEGSCDQNIFSEIQLNEALEAFGGIKFEIKEQEKINWNEEWEKNYDPIIVDNRCIVRASFHEPQPSFAYEIIVTPKMSFGTGHHATTYQILSYQMTLDHNGKKVMDVGTGTGILAIMAHKRGASYLLASDIDDWCIENSQENFSLNAVRNVRTLKAEIDQIEESEFDIIIANINKNVLLDQIGEYEKRLVRGGQLILSGFYQEDVNDLKIEASKLGLDTVKTTNRDNWAMLVLSKPSV